MKITTNSKEYNTYQSTRKMWLQYPKMSPHLEQVSVRCLQLLVVLPRPEDPDRYLPSGLAKAHTVEDATDGEPDLGGGWYFFRVV